MRGWIGGVGGSAAITAGVIAAARAALAYVTFHDGGSTRATTGHVDQIGIGGGGANRHDADGVLASERGAASAPGGRSTGAHSNGSHGGRRRADGRGFVRHGGGNNGGQVPVDGPGGGGRYGGTEGGSGGALGDNPVGNTVTNTGQTVGAVTGLGQTVGGTLTGVTGGLGGGH